MNKGPLALLVLPLLLACSFEYNEDVEVDAKDAALPDVSLTQSRQVFYRDGTLSLVLEAQLVESFNSEQRQNLQGILVESYDDQGELVFSGSANEAELNTVNDDVELRGNIRIRYVPEMVTIEAQYFFWDAELEQLTAAQDELVTIQRDDGTIFNGRGLVVYSAERRLEFTEESSGTLVDEAL